jgi:hypothetical protein
MATTPNFNWSTPDNTGLVKNGALDIRTLGNSIDASMADLKGGTTGQILAKATDTDMDFAWVADAGGISPTIVNAKGDIIGASANDTPAITSVGANGETLVADSSTSTGLRYQTGVNLNGVINGGMDIWQRGISFAIPSSTYTYTADRWIGLRFSTGATVSQQTASLDGFQYSARVARDSGNSGLGIIYFGYNLETADSYKYAGKTVTLSFWAKAGADFSSASSALSVVWASGTGTNQKQMDGFTGSSSLANSSVTLTTLWQRFSFTAAVPSNSTQQGFQFNYTPVGTAGVADNFEVVGVQLEFGSIPTNFKRAGGGTIQGELAACQRYYWLMGSGTASVLGTGLMQSATRMHQPVIFPVTMRIAPSLSATSGTNYYNFQTSGDDQFNSLTISTATTQSCYVFNNSEISGTAGQAGTTLTNNASASVAFSAEL